MGKNDLKLGCIVMAAGSSKRFGGNKLAEVIGGYTVFERALMAVPEDILYNVVVVTQYPEAAALAEKYGFRCVLNPEPEAGVSLTIRLGLEALGDCDGILFQVADQPLLRRETVRTLLERFQEEPVYIWGLAHNGKKGNPCIFPGEYREELMALEGDRGGSKVIRAHEELLRLLEVPACELMDVDTREAMEGVRQQGKAAN